MNPLYFELFIGKVLYKFKLVFWEAKETNKSQTKKKKKKILVFKTVPNVQYRI